MYCVHLDCVNVNRTLVSEAHRLKLFSEFLLPVLMCNSKSFSVSKDHVSCQEKDKCTALTSSWTCDDCNR